MSTIALGAVRSCGVTTLAVALAATWPAPRRVLVVEADPAGGTLAAASGWPPEPGLVSLAAATRRGGGLTTLFDHCHALPGGAPVLAAPASGDQARHVLAMLDGALAGLGTLAADVLLDCGRLAPTAFAADTGGSAACFAAADRAILVARPRLADLHALLSWLSGAPPLVPPERLGLVLVGDGPYPDDEVEGALGVAVLGRIPNDPEAADALLAVSAADRVLRRAPLVRAAHTLAAALGGADRMTDETERAPRPRLAGIGSLRPWHVTGPAAPPNGHGASSGVAVSNGSVTPRGPEVG